MRSSYKLANKVSEAKSKEVKFDHFLAMRNGIKYCPMSQNVQNSGEEKDAELRSAASPKYNKTGTDVVSGTAHMSNMTRDERQPTSSAITDSVIDLVDWTNPNNFTQTVQIPAADLQNLQSL